MHFGRKHFLGLFFIAIILVSAFIWETLPTWSINSNVANIAGNGSDESNSTETDGNPLNGSAVETVQSEQPEPSYRRGRDFERWAYPNRTVSLTMYMGPRFVRHYATGEFVDIVFEDHYSTEGYYLVQNAYVGLKIYDNKTVMLNPDMEYVSVEEEYLTVHVYNANSSLWMDLDLGKPSLRVDVNNDTDIVVTRIFESDKGRLEVSYIVRSGAYLKHQVSFTSNVSTEQTYRIAQVFAGIRGTKFSYVNSTGLINEVSNVTSVMELEAPLFTVRNEFADILSVNLYDLGTWDNETGEWKGVDLEGMLLEPDANGLKAGIYIGNRTLRSGESISIDPLITTFQVQLGVDDTYEDQLGPDSNRYNYPEIRFGKQFEQWPPYGIIHTYRTYLRWQLLIPDGGIVTEAYLSIKAKSSTTIAFAANIKLINSNNCPPFNPPTVPWNLGTTGNVAWYNGSWTQGNWYTSPNISSLVSAFMDIQGYALGNYIGLKIDEGDVSNPTEGDSQHYKEGYSADCGSIYAAKLNITFIYPYNETFVEPLENWSFEDGSAWSTDNLLLHMDEGYGKTAYDSGPYGNDGSIKAHHGTITGASWAEGKFGKALSFDGVDDYVSIPSSASLKLGGSITFEAWVKWDNYLDGSHDTFMEKGLHDANGINYLFGKFSNGRLKFTYSDGSWRNVVESSGWTATNGVWYHIAIVVNKADNKVYFYVNGMLKSAVTDPNNLNYPLNDEDLRIGENTGGDEEFAGKLDDLHIYNQALSGPEVSSRFSGVDLRDGLTAEWRFDEGSGGSAADTHMWTAGRYGEALQLDGVDDYVEVPNSASLQITDDITVEAWIKIDSGGATDQRVILQKDGSYRLMVRHDPYRHLEVWLWLPEDGGAATLVGGDPISYDVWHHVSFTRNKSTGIVKTYVDGVEQASASGKTSSIAVNTNPVIVGKGWNEFDGVIDEVRVSDGKTATTVSSTTYMHGKHSLRVEGSSNQDAMVAQLLSKEVVEYIRNRKPNQYRGVRFSFWYKPESVVPDGTKNKARAEIYYEYPGGSNTVYGLWVKPNDTEPWHMAQVNVSLPTDTQMVKVRIRGTYYGSEGFKAWIDRASLSVYYSNRTNNPTYGDITLVTSLYHSEPTQIPEFDGFASFGVAVAAKAKTGYSVFKVTLQVELLPNNGSATTQQGRLVILYFQQKNSKGFKLDPRTSQELINSATSTGQLAWSALWIGLDVAFTIATAPGIPLKYALLWCVGGGALSSVPIFAEKVHNPLAEGGTSYKVWEILDYSTEMESETDRIEHMGTEYYFDWRFKTDSDDIFAIKVSATVEWGVYTGYPPPPHWQKIGESTASCIISIANYWQ